MAARSWGRISRRRQHEFNQPRIDHSGRVRYTRRVHFVTSLFRHHGFLAATAFLALLLTLAKLLLYVAASRYFVGSTATLCQWDCGWYMQIATLGYNDAPLPGTGWANWAFFPLYPMLWRGVADILPLSVAASGIVLSTIIFLAFLVLAAVYRRRTRPADDTTTWLLFATVWPFGFYFHAPYSESVYLLLSTLVLLCLAQGRLLGAGLATGLLSASRVTGILLVPVILFAGWRAFRRALPTDRPRMAATILLALVLAPLGLFAYMAYLHVHTGDTLAFSHIQISWNRHFGNPLHNLASGLRHPDIAALFDLHRPPAPGWTSLFGALGLVVSAWLAWRRRWAEAWFCAATILVAASTGVDSLPRYVSGNAGFLFGTCDLLASNRLRPARAGVCACLAALQAVLLVAWFAGAGFLI